jgi:tRNA A-37 threonylcarbamoyl transferase component Bud32
MVGTILGNYKILQQIGEGGMGAVFKGVDLMLEREVAIKALRPELARQPNIVERFRAEAVTLAKLNHPNIATLHSFFRQGDDFFMVMEFVRGETLDSVLRRFGGMTCEHAIPLFCQALEGIDHAHRLGIVHRDIKPANMMLTETGSIKVMDFGIARVLGTARMTKQGNIIGTIEYMSPEQVRGFETDARSDIYSLGILLYEMLTGRVPFHNDSEFSLMKSQIEDAPVPPRDIAAHIPIEIEAAIMRSLAKNPDARFQSAAEFRGALLGDQAVRPALSQPGLVAAPLPPMTGLATTPIQVHGPEATPSGQYGQALRATDGDQIKGTRLGSENLPGGPAQGAFGEMPKETRLGGVDGAGRFMPGAVPQGGPQPAYQQGYNPQVAGAGYSAGPYGHGAQQQPAPGKLNWKILAVAACALVFFLGAATFALISLTRKPKPPVVPAGSTASPNVSLPGGGTPVTNDSLPGNLPTLPASGGLVVAPPSTDQTTSAQDTTATPKSTEPAKKTRVAERSRSSQDSSGGQASGTQSSSASSAPPARSSAPDPAPARPAATGGGSDRPPTASKPAGDPTRRDAKGAPIKEGDKKDGKVKGFFKKINPFKKEQ